MYRHLVLFCGATTILFLFFLFQSPFTLANDKSTTRGSCKDAGLNDVLVNKYVGQLLVRATVDGIEEWISSSNFKNKPSRILYKTVLEGGVSYSAASFLYVADFRETKNSNDIVVGIRITSDLNDSIGHTRLHRNVTRFNAIETNPNYQNSLSNAWSFFSGQTLTVRRWFDYKFDPTRHKRDLLSPEKKERLSAKYRFDDAHELNKSRLAMRLKLSSAQVGVSCVDFNLSEDRIKNIKIVIFTEDEKSTIHIARF